MSDAAKSRTFSKFAREITMESKKAAGNISSPTLAAVIARAKAVNMPKDNIERAVAKGISKDSGDLEQVVYEFYGPGGVAIITRAVTDSRNRSTQEIKSLLAKNEYELGVPGSALWAFSKTSDGRFVANEPHIEISGDDETRLSSLLSHLDDLDDIQEICTNARGYENTGD